MSVSNSHKIQNYYDYFRDKEVVFTKANLKFLRMDPRQIYIKCNGGQWPCILNSSSLQMAKIIVGTNSGIFQEINKNKNKALVLSLRYCFFDMNNQPVQFFVNCNVLNVSAYKDAGGLALITLQFTQRPPDDLISRIGEFLEVNKNFETRKEERIAINQNSLRQLGIPKEETFIFIADVPRKCILKDLSFGGAKVLTVGIPKFLLEKKVNLRLMFIESSENVSISGVIKNADFLPGRKDIAIIHIEFITEEIPMSYKFHINSYITSYQKQLIQNQIANQLAERKAESEAEKKAEMIKAAKAAALAASQNKDAVVDKTAETKSEKVDENKDASKTQEKSVADKTSEKTVEATSTPAATNN